MKNSITQPSYPSNDGLESKACVTLRSALTNHTHVARVRLLCICWLDYWTSHAPLQRSAGKKRLAETEDFILSDIPALSFAVDFQRRNRQAVVKSTRQVCRTQIASLQQLCDEIEASLSPMGEKKCWSQSQRRHTEGM